MLETELVTQHTSQPKFTDQTIIKVLFGDNYTLSNKISNKLVK